MKNDLDNAKTLNERIKQARALGTAAVEEVRKVDPEAAQRVELYASELQDAADELEKLLRKPEILKVFALVKSAMTREAKQRGGWHIWEVFERVAMEEDIEAARKDFEIPEVRFESVAESSPDNLLVEIYAACKRELTDEQAAIDRLLDVPKSQIEEIRQRYRISAEPKDWNKLDILIEQLKQVSPYFEGVAEIQEWIDSGDMFQELYERSMRQVRIAWHFIVLVFAILAKQAERPKRIEELVNKKENELAKLEDELEAVKKELALRNDEKKGIETSLAVLEERRKTIDKIREMEEQDINRFRAQHEEEKRRLLDEISDLKARVSEELGKLDKYRERAYAPERFEKIKPVVKESGNSSEAVSEAVAREEPPSGSPGKGPRDGSEALAPRPGWLRTVGQVAVRGRKLGPLWIKEKPFGSKGNHTSQYRRGKSYILGPNIDGALFEKLKQDGLFMKEDLAENKDEVPGE